MRKQRKLTSNLLSALAPGPPCGLVCQMTEEQQKDLSSARRQQSHMIHRDIKYDAYRKAKQEVVNWECSLLDSQLQLREISSCCTKF